MKHKSLIALGLLVALTVLMVTVVSAADKTNMAKARKATAQFGRIEAAEAAGYTRLDGLENCFDNQVDGGV